MSPRLRQYLLLRLDSYGPRVINDTILRALISLTCLIYHVHTTLSMIFLTRSHKHYAGRFEIHFGASLNKRSSNDRMMDLPSIYLRFSLIFNPITISRKTVDYDLPFGHFGAAMLRGLGTGFLAITRDPPSRFA